MLQFRDMQTEEIFYNVFIESRGFQNNFQHYERKY